MTGGLTIREIGADEFGLLWPIFHDVVAAGDTYSYAPDTSFDEARRLWTSGDARCFVALLDGV
ncbi:MAG TPA: GNAT family N-acetyltransferase, partial [Rudaea sp.]|nr:GNAT family N-acetyltransferase [Rudaea sp.]